MKEPLVSIITPVYNCERYLADTIESILSQTYENWELLLINDASHDGSSEIAKHYQSKDHRIHLFHLSSNSGAAVARNLGLTRATGKYVAFLDGDDLWKPQKLARQVHFMEKKQLPFYVYKLSNYARRWPGAT